MIIDKLEEQEKENQRMKSYLDPSDEVFAELEKDSKEVRQILDTYKSLRKKTNDIFVADYRHKLVTLNTENKEVHERIEEIKRTIQNLKRSNFDSTIESLQRQADEKRREISGYRTDISALEIDIGRLSEGLPKLPALNDLYEKRKTAEGKLEVGDADSGHSS